MVQGADGQSNTPNHSKRSKKRRKLAQLVTPGLTAMLDRTKVTDHKAVLIVAETTKSLGHEVQDLALSRSSIRRLRQDHRAEISTGLKQEFLADAPLVVHWDGKLLRDLTGTEKLDRLPILVSGQGVTQLACLQPNSFHRLVLPKPKRISMH